MLVGFLLFVGFCLVSVGFAFLFFIAYNPARRSVPSYSLHQQRIDGKINQTGNTRDRFPWLVEKLAHNGKDARSLLLETICN